MPWEWPKKRQKDKKKKKESSQYGAWTGEGTTDEKTVSVLKMMR